jgi:tRNA(His) 5'-end guanylyltransferase
MDAMVYSAAKIVEDFQPALAYIQSDEVSFLFSGDVTPPMGGRVVKISSRLAAQMTSSFVRELSETFPRSLDKRHPHFDGRLSWFDDEETAAHNIQWREMDARKNAVSAAAAVVFSEPALRGKHTAERLRMLKDAGIDFDGYPADFKSGVFLRRVTELREITEEEMAPSPKQYRPTGPVERTTIKMFNLPPLPKISNIVPVLFRGEEPIVAASASGVS